MAKRPKQKPKQLPLTNSLERLRRATKLRLAREVRLEKQIAALSRTLERLVARRGVELRQLANFLTDTYGDPSPSDLRGEPHDERLELAEA